MRRLLLGMAIAATAALLPATSQADDQQIAEFIKSRLQVEQQQGNLRGFNVDMRVDRGTVWFKGQVSTEAQEKLILQTAQQAGYLGVVQVVDDIEVAPVSNGNSDVAAASAPNPIRQQQLQRGNPQPQPYQSASYQEPVNFVPPRPVPARVPAQVPSYTTGDVYSSGAPLPFAQAGSQGSGTRVPASAPVSPDIYGDISGGPIPGGHISGGYDPGLNGGAGLGIGSPAPIPIGSGGGGVSGTPNLPGYAWPGYAASPNYAALSYPKQYSPSAWPYIGPFYPYPQVPLGWRKVQLEWDDGWWFLDFRDH